MYHKINFDLAGEVIVFLLFDQEISETCIAHHLSYIGK